MKGKTNTPTDRKYLIAYYAHCIDGFTAAYTAHTGLTKNRKVDPKNISLLPIEYGKLDELHAVVGKVDELYIVDFSLPVATLAAYEETYPDLVTVVIDHHKTAQEMYGSLNTIHGAQIVFDLNESGATLTWRYFFACAPVPKLLQYVRDYDLWKFELDGTKYINRYLRVQAQTLERWAFIEQDFMYACSVREAKGLGEAIELYHQQVVADLVDTAVDIALAGEIGKVVNCSPHFASDVGHELALLSGTFGATWQQAGVNSVAKWSLRSNGEYDVSAIAKQFGGGGHRNAAGFSLTPEGLSDAERGVSLWAGN